LQSSSYKCPYCYHDCTVGDADVRTLGGEDLISLDHGTYRGSIIITTCPNKTCRKQKISVTIVSLDTKLPPLQFGGAPAGQEHRLDRIKKIIYMGQLLPESEGKVFPDYIPKQLRNDYLEACLIKDKSPKASATLSRRCLQGMIRDFWGITKARLIDEIEELKSHVDATTWGAIDSVRQVGNIGAHMEKDVNIIIDVDENEAGLLIWLIETLFQEWYIARFDRKERMHALTSMANKKKKVTSTQKSVTKKK